MIPKVSSNHKDHKQLHKELDAAQQKVVVEDIYSHYKYPENQYRVIKLGFIEATDEVCVIYQAVYDKDLIFVRPLSSWLETPEWKGKLVNRFQLVV